MTKSKQIYCFQADCKLSHTFEEHQVPDWLSLEVNWQGYKISTIPWIAEVAQVLGILFLEEDTPESWISYLESLGLRGITQVSCESFFESRLYY
jgi:hypothetical protein